VTDQIDQTAQAGGKATALAVAPSRDATDAELVDATQRGDLAAFAELSRRYRDRYMRFALRMLGNRDDAEDALQSAFIRAYRAIDRCRDASRVGAWLYQIVANECRSLALRRARRERRIVRDEITLQATAAVPPAEQDWVEDIEYALAQLEIDQREAFVMKHIEQLSYEEMADITGDGISALKMRVKRACARLRDLLEEVYDE
jgi:RNA polymerase sigma-70 factor (ECF subfamily)